MKLEESSNTNIEEPQGQKAKVSTLSVIAFTLSIMSIASIFLFYHLVLYVAITAMVVGCIALIASKRRQEKIRGKSMAVIGLVISLILIVLVSALARVMPLVYELKQKAQFLYIGTSLELFKHEFDYYPQSGAMDDEGQYYCGAMKLCEAMMGQDLQGFHLSSKFRADGLDELGLSLYDTNTLEDRKGPYLPEGNGNPYRLKDLYGNVDPFDGNDYVLCDKSKCITHTGTGERIGMPVLYYKANTSKTAHNVDDPNNPENIYDYRDNHALLALGVPGKPGQKHPLYENPKIFYEMTRDYRIAEIISKPNSADRFILLSSGLDGLYGTKDDIANFDIQWKPK
jgi:hypothetical protein